MAPTEPDSGSSKAAIALGSNLGDRLEHLRAAVRAIAGFGAVVAVSPLYETAPVGGPDQGPYLNAVVVIETSMAPRQLLAELHALERAAGRTRDVRWGPRTLDLDLILHGRSVVDDEQGLELPHPRFRDRRFVLEPLLAAWPGATEPDGTPLAPLLDAVIDQELTYVDGPGWIGTASGADRGGRWVAGQVIALGLHVIALGLAPGSLAGSASGWRSVGVALAIASVVLFLASSAGLGRMLTPYPQPIERGRLITGGVYGRARHPMYGSVLLLAAAATAWTRSLPALATTIALTLFFTAKSRHEETRLRAVYPGYAEYEANVPRRFIPWVL